MSSIKTTMTADAQDLLQKQAKVAEGAAFISNEYRKLTSEAQRLNTAARRAFDDSRTPLERYTQKVQQLDELLKRGKISQDTHARAVEQAAQKYETATKAGASWDAVLTKLVSYGAGFLSVGSAISVVTRAMQQAREEAEKAAETLKAGFATRGELAQIVEGRTQDEMRADLASLRAEAARFRTQGGMPTESLANEVVFALRSTGFMPDAGLFRDVGRTGLVSAEKIPQLINSLDSLRDAMGGAEVGTVEQMLNKALIAGAVSQTDIQKNLSAAAMAGSGAAALGISDEETLAAIAVLTDPLGSAEQAATRMRSLFKSLEKAGIKGPLGTSLDSLVGKDVPGMLGGDQEAIQAYRLLQTQRAIFDKLSQEMVAGQTGTALRDRLAVAMTDAQQRAGIAGIGVEGAIDVGRERLGTRESLIQSLNASIDELRRLQGVSPLRRMIEGWERNAPLVGSLRAFDSPLFATPAEAAQMGKQTPEATAILAQILETQRLLYELSRDEKQQRELRQRTDDAKKTPRPNVPRPEA